MERTSKRHSWLSFAVASLLPLLQAVFSQALAQGQEATVAPILTTSPIIGTSTLDQLRASRGDQLELQFPSGFTCRITSGDKPTLVLYGDQGSLVAGDVSGISGLRAGMAVVVPLYRSKSNTCDDSMTLYHQLNKLEIAEKLVTAGAMTNQEYMELAKKIKSKLLGSKQ